jgi:hypothetical protein
MSSARLVSGKANYFLTRETNSLQARVQTPSSREVKTACPSSRTYPRLSIILLVDANFMSSCNSCASRRSVAAIKSGFSAQYVPPLSLIACKYTNVVSGLARESDRSVECPPRANRVCCFLGGVYVVRAFKLVPSSACGAKAQGWLRTIE